MGRTNISLSAERQALAYFAMYPNKIFDFDGNVLQESDFSNSATQCIYSVLRDYAQEQATANPPEIDAIVLEERLSNKYSSTYSAQQNDFHAIISAIKDSPVLEDIDEYVKIIVAESIKKKAKARLYDVAETIESINEPTKIIEVVEKEIFDFTNAAINDVDVENIANGYETYLNNLAVEASKGEVKVGIQTGFPTWDNAIGGGLRRSTINTIASRAGYGKSLIGGRMAINIAAQGFPVLLIDTELNKSLQMNRFAAMDAEVPITSIETGKIFSDPALVQKIVDSKNKLENLQLDYVTTKGWTVQQQVSLIRRWMAKKVGRQEDGQYKHAVVILDYLKLLNEKDKGDSKEWEVLGYRMTAFHDLMNQYGASMLMFAQQNRAGLDRDDESTVSGSDRIIWLCDNFSVLFKIQFNQDAAEANAESDENDQYPNMGLRVSKCRHGRGTPQGRFVGLYSDKEDPRVAAEQVCGTFIDKGLTIAANT